MSASIGTPVENIAGAPGDASRRKLLRSSFMKGLGALIVESLLLLRALSSSSPGALRIDLSPVIVENHYSLQRTGFGGEQDGILVRTFSVNHNRLVLGIDLKHIRRRTNARPYPLAFLSVNNDLQSSSPTSRLMFSIVPQAKSNILHRLLGKVV